MAEVFNTQINLGGYEKPFLEEKYKTVTRICRFDENLIRLMQEGEVSGSYHSSQGSETPVGGISLATTTIFSTITAAAIRWLPSECRCRNCMATSSGQSRGRQAVSAWELWRSGPI